MLHPTVSIALAAFTAGTLRWVNLCNVKIYDSDLCKNGNQEKVEFLYAKFVSSDTCTSMDSFNFFPVLLCKYVVVNRIYSL